VSKWNERFWSFLASYAASAAFGVTGAVVAWPFGKALVAAFEAYDDAWFQQYFAVVIIGWIVCLLQCFVLSWRTKPALFVSSLCICLVLWITYALMDFPAHAPVLGWIDTSYGFVLYVVGGSQLFAIAGMAAVALVEAVRRRKPPESR